MHPLHIQHLTHRFQSDFSPSVTALHKVSLHAEPKEFIAITGPSGSGKSTLLYILAGLLRPTSGEILYAETDIYTLSHSKRNRFRAQNIGILYPDFQLLPFLSIAENIATPALTLSLSKKEISNRTSQLISQFSLDERASHLPNALSSGEQQRTALARALFSNPSFIIADEPTGNLDDVNSSLIAQTLKDYASQGNTVIIATHDPIIIHSATKTITINQGNLIA